HPELLDYLAAQFVREGWSTKKLTREILLSSTYRQSSEPRPDVAAADPQNKLLAVYPRRRMDAEQIRDSLLAAAGDLDERVGGPSVLPPLPKNGASGESYQGDPYWTVSKNEADYNRRSLYVFTRRSVPYPMLEAFDRASPQVPHSRREVSTTPQQSLTLFNNEVVYQWSQQLAARAAREGGDSEAARIERLYRILYARKPDALERKLVVAFLKEQTELLRAQSSPAAEAGAQKVSLRTDVKITDARERAFADLAHTLANANEFVYRY
ncbi:MAG: DUF1553 domain-containing protein, partial [Steroidobacteraceae bacterium]